MDGLVGTGKVVVKAPVLRTVAAALLLKPPTAEVSAVNSLTAMAAVVTPSASALSSSPEPSSVPARALDPRKVDWNLHVC